MQGTYTHASIEHSVPSHAGMFRIIKYSVRMYACMLHTYLDVSRVLVHTRQQPQDGDDGEQDPAHLVVLVDEVQTVRHIIVTCVYMCVQVCACV